MVRLHFSSQTKKWFYLAMELCNGGDLDMIRKIHGGSLPEDQARGMLRQIIKGMVDLKNTGVIHRDLKLENIILHFPNMPSQFSQIKSYIQAFDCLSQEVTLKVADLGLARTL